MPEVERLIEKCNTRELNALASSYGISVELIGRALTVDEKRKVISSHIKRTSGLGEDFARDLKEIKNTLIPKNNFLKRIDKNNTRQCLFLLAILFEQWNRHNIPGRATSGRMDVVHALRKFDFPANLLVSKIDNSPFDYLLLYFDYMHQVPKERKLILLDELNAAWGNVEKYKGYRFSNLDRSNEYHCKRALDYLRKSPSKRAKSGFLKPNIVNIFNNISDYDRFLLSVDLWDVEAKTKADFHRKFNDAYREWPIKPVTIKRPRKKKEKLAVNIRLKELADRQGFTSDDEAINFLLDFYYESTRLENTVFRRIRLQKVKYLNKLSRSQAYKDKKQLCLFVNQKKLKCVQEYQLIKNNGEYNNQLMVSKPVKLGNRMGKNAIFREIKK